MRYARNTCDDGGSLDASWRSVSVGKALMNEKWQDEMMEKLGACDGFIKKNRCQAEPYLGIKFVGN